MKKPKAIVFDIDGVLLKTDFILKEIEEKGLKGDVKWEYFYEHCNSDRVKAIPNMVELYKAIQTSAYHYIMIICTARNRDNCYALVNKLKQEVIPFDFIYMRKSNDLRSDTDVKRDLLKQIQEQYDIVAFIDDKQENCEMAKSLGIFSLRVV